MGGVTELRFGGLGGIGSDAIPADFAGGGYDEEHFTDEGIHFAPGRGRNRRYQRSPNYSRRNERFQDFAVPTLDSESEGSESDEFLSDDDNEGGEMGDPNGVKFLYRDSTWKKTHFTYDPKPQEFIGTSRANIFWRSFPTMLQLFEVFWTHYILRDIVRETNRYATVVDNDGNSMGGAGWVDFTVPELKAFMAIWLYMGMKRQPHIESYWHRRGSIYHCSTISKIMTRTRFKALTRCLHITNPTNYVRERDLPGYDKLGQIRWLIEIMQENCKKLWKLGEFCTIDEMMIRYKGSYCPLRQYMPQKPQKWGIKVWCLACSVSKYVWNFSIYCGKSQVVRDEQPVARGEPKLAHNVVLDLARAIEGRGHVIAMDNFFTSVGLFRDLLSRTIYATGTMRSNRIGVPLVLRNTKEYRKKEQGWMDWRMHESRSMASVVWKDKKPVLLLSTHAQPTTSPGLLVQTVPRRNGAIREDIPTSPMHLEYTTHMRGVDVADQLRASYCTQNRSHKWWHRVFFFLLDMTVVNMFLIYIDKCKNMSPVRKPMSHLQFRTDLCEALLLRWRVREEDDLCSPPAGRGYCYPVHSNKRNPCVVCNKSKDQKGKRPHYYCSSCDNKFMCFKGPNSCFQKYHDNLRRQRPRNVSYSKNYVHVFLLLCYSVGLISDLDLVLFLLHSIVVVIVITIYSKSLLVIVVIGRK
jgi:hypothetical protein